MAASPSSSSLFGFEVTFTTWPRSALRPTGVRLVRVSHWNPSGRGVVGGGGGGGDKCRREKDNRRKEKFPAQDFADDERIVLCRKVERDLLEMLGNVWTKLKQEMWPRG